MPQGAEYGNNPWLITTTGSLHGEGEPTLLCHFFSRAAAVSVFPF